MLEYFGFKNIIMLNNVFKITEKFFLAIGYNIIPVVRGLGKYDDYVSKYF